MAAENRYKRRISKSTEVQTINENEEFTIIYSRYSGNQDVRTKEHLKQKGQSALENGLEFLLPTTSSDMKTTATTSSFKTSTSIIIGFATCLIGICFIQKVTSK